MGIPLGGKRVDLHLLTAEATAAGVVVGDLGTAGDDLVTYDEDGHTIDPPAGMAAVLAAHVPPAPLTDYAGAYPMSGRLRTTDATPAEVYRRPLAPMTGYRALATLLAVDAGNGVVRMIHASIVAKRLSGGALLVGSPVVLANHQDSGAAATTANVAGWAIAASVSGNDFVITVAGAAGRTVDWLLDGQVLSFKPGGPS
jgi:hypothetical protein